MDWPTNRPTGEMHEMSRCLTNRKYHGKQSLSSSSMMWFDAWPNRLLSSPIQHTIHRQTDKQTQTHIHPSTAANDCQQRSSPTCQNLFKNLLLLPSHSPPCSPIIASNGLSLSVLAACNHGRTTVRQFIELYREHDFNLEQVQHSTAFRVSSISPLIHPLPFFLPTLLR